jgi:uncharacterized protein (TIGR03546 family)
LTIIQKIIYNSYGFKNKEDIPVLKSIGKFIIALNGNLNKSQIAAGAAWGVLLGLVPLSSPFGIVLFIFSFFFTHNHSSKILVMAIIKILSMTILLKLDELGWWILHIDSLQPLFTTMYNMPFVPFTKFNNTLVIGGLAAGIVLWLPVFFLFITLIPLYRNHVAPKIKNSKFVKKLATSPLLGFIDKMFTN